jgi:hypothetical protein
MRPAAEADAESRVSARALVAVIGAGVFVTGFGWPGIIGRIPFTLLLKNQLGLGADKVASFWAVATFAWYCKPLVGLICDAYPFAGTRRRGYMLWGSVAAGACWLGFAVVPFLRRDAFLLNGDPLMPVALQQFRHRPDQLVC